MWAHLETAAIKDGGGGDGMLGWHVCRSGLGWPTRAGRRLGCRTSPSTNSRTTSGSTCRGSTWPGRPCGSSPGSARGRRPCLLQGNPLHRSIPEHRLVVEQVVRDSSLQAWVAVWCYCSSRHQGALADHPTGSTLRVAPRRADPWVRRLTPA